MNSLVKITDNFKNNIQISTHSQLVKMAAVDEKFYYACHKISDYKWVFRDSIGQERPRDQKKQHHWRLVLPKYNHDVIRLPEDIRSIIAPAVGQWELVGNPECVRFTKVFVILANMRLL